MGGGTSTIYDPSRVTKSEIVNLMMPAYFCSEPCSLPDVIIARKCWDMILNGKAANYIKLRDQPNFECVNCAAYFQHCFFQRLMDVHPISRGMYSNTKSTQGPHLISLLSLSLSDVDVDNGKSAKFVDRLTALVNMHNSKGVKAAEYGLVGDVLFWSLKQCIGIEEFESTAKLAWIKVYSRMLAIMVPLAVSYEMAQLVSETPTVRVAVHPNYQIDQSISDTVHIS